MLVFAFEWNLFFTRNNLCIYDAAPKKRLQMTCTSSSLWIGMESTLYLWHSSKERIAVDLHLVILADRDGAYVVFWRSSEEKVAVDLHLVVLADEDGAHVVLVAQLRGEDCSRPAHRCPCG